LVLQGARQQSHALPSRRVCSGVISGTEECRLDCRLWATDGVGAQLAIPSVCWASNTLVEHRPCAAIHGPTGL
jgi:hypothetical protein